MFKDHIGKISAIRVMSFIALLGALTFAYMTVSGNGGNDGSIITLQFLVAAFAPKAIQRFVEVKK